MEKHREPRGAIGGGGSERGALSVRQTGREADQRAGKYRSEPSRQKGEEEEEEEEEERVGRSVEDPT